MNQLIITISIHFNGILIRTQTEGKFADLAETSKYEERDGRKRRGGGGVEEGRNRIQIRPKKIDCNSRKSHLHWQH